MAEVHFKQLFKQYHTETASKSVVSIFIFLLSNYWNTCTHRYRYMYTLPVQTSCSIPVTS